MSYSNISYSVSQSSISSAYNKCVRYMRRIFKFEQMDFQFALWQMIYLFLAPQKLIKVFRARKQSKSQYARDDPAFLVLFAGALFVTSIGFVIVLNLSFIQFIKFLSFVIFVDCIGAGLVIATVLWYLTNTFLKPKINLQDIEWGFSFDMHLNAFFPPLILLHFIQLFFYNGLISYDWFPSILLGNTFWLCASVYYVYITFLGYNSVQILNNTRFLLAPIPLFILVYVVSLFAKWNMTQSLMYFYQYRSRILS